MPRVGFTPEYGGNGSDEKFPRLKLREEERGRICVVEQPWSEWVHSLSKVKFQNGEPLLEKRTRADKSEYTVFDTDFIGYRICLGNPDVLNEKGADPENCPACQGNQQNADAVAPAKRRYAMNVVQYNCAQNTTFAVPAPFSAKIVMWTPTAKMFDKMITFTNQVQAGQPPRLLRNYDLLLGPCEKPERWQRYEMQFADHAAWMQDTNTQAFMGALWQPANRATDEQLQAACGTRIGLAFLQNEVAQCLSAWLQANSAGPSSTTAPGGFTTMGQQPGQPGLDQGFGTLLGGTPPPAAHPMAQQAAMATGDPFSGQQQAAPPAQPPTWGEPAQPQQPQPQAAPAMVMPAPGNPFGDQPQAAPAPPQQFPAAAVPQPSGFAEFAPGTTSNPQGYPGQQGFAVMPQQGMSVQPVPQAPQQGFPAPQPQAASAPPQQQPFPGPGVQPAQPQQQAPQQPAAPMTPLPAPAAPEPSFTDLFQQQPQA